MLLVILGACSVCLKIQIMNIRPNHKNEYFILSCKVIYTYTFVLRKKLGDEY
jgi:hypothetical protein